MIGTMIYINNNSIPFNDLTITDTLFQANKASFKSNIRLGDMDNVHIIGEHQQFSGQVTSQSFSPEGYEYEATDYTRLLFGSVFKSYKNKTSSEIIKDLLTGTGIGNSGVVATGKRYTSLVFKNNSRYEVCQQLVNLEKDMEFKVNNNLIAEFRKVPSSVQGYVFDASKSISDYNFEFNSEEMITSVKVYGEDDKLLYTLNNNVLKAKYGDIVEIIENSSLKTQAQAKVEAEKLFSEKAKVQLTGDITVPILPLLRAGMWIVFLPPTNSGLTAKSYYTQEVKTVINDKTANQQVTLVDAKPVPPSEWVYEEQETVKSASGTTTVTNNKCSGGVIETKACQLGSPQAIRKWIDANFKYEYYWNHKHSTDAVWKRRKANCVDQAYLFIRMVKALGYNAKLVCGKKCNGIGHCNAEIYMNGRWIVADTTCHKLNRL